MPTKSCSIHQKLTFQNGFSKYFEDKINTLAVDQSHQPLYHNLVLPTKMSEEMLSRRLFVNEADNLHYPLAGAAKKWGAPPDLYSFMYQI
jgi:hypothetical protein